VLSPALSIGAIAAAPETQGTTRHPLVAIIDSGIARTPEIGGALIAEYDMAVKPARAAFRPRYDHGTMVATIMLREATQPIDIVSLRVDDLEGCPQGANPPCQRDVGPIVEAIKKATELGVSVINISLNLKEDPRIVNAVRAAAKRGIAVVLAAGNDGADHPGNLGMAKAGFPNTVLVGALDAAGQPWKGTNRPEAGDPG
jgi:subtilisin family serine protease